MYIIIPESKAAYGNFVAKTPNAKNKYNDPPLHWAARNGHLETVQYLIEHTEADPDAKTKNGVTPLHCAAQNAAEAGCSRL